MFSIGIGEAVVLSVICFVTFVPLLAVVFVALRGKKKPDRRD